MVVSSKQANITKSSNIHFVADTVLDLNHGVCIEKKQLYQTERVLAKVNLTFVHIFGSQNSDCTYLNIFILLLILAIFTYYRITTTLFCQKLLVKYIRKVNSLPNDKIMDKSKLKAFADDNLTHSLIHHVETQIQRSCRRQLKFGY